MDAGEKENPVLLLSKDARFYWKLHFGCVRTTLSQLKRVCAHTSVASHILSKPLHICK